MTDVKGKSSLAPAVSRAVQILTVLADARGRTVNLADLARELGAAKSSTSNICSVLEETGMVQRRESGYTLGRRTVELGGAYLASFDQVREFYRITAESPVLSHELVQISILDGTDVLYLARHEGRAPLRFTAGIGDRFPAALTAIGNALLAELDPAEVVARYEGRDDAFPRLTERSTGSLDALLEKLRQTRERGYALDVGEVFPNVVGLAVTVAGSGSGMPTFAIGVSTFDSTGAPTLSDDHRDSILGALRDAADQLSNPMGADALRLGRVSQP